MCLGIEAAVGGSFVFCFIYVKHNNGIGGDAHGRRRGSDVEERRGTSVYGKKQRDKMGVKKKNRRERKAKEGLV